MSLRHMPRQPERVHDSSLSHPHPLVSHPPSSHPPHINGTSTIPTTPGGLSNGSSHPNSIISPTAIPTTVAPNGVTAPSSTLHRLAVANEQTWLLIGRVAEQMGDLEHALSAYENALRHNPMSLSGLTQVAGIARIKENYPKAIEYFQRVLNLQEDNGEVWSALGHCYLMQDDLQKAYSAYQQALYMLPSPKEDPKLWYGIGILYDRYGSLDHAEEAFSSVLRMDKDLDFDKANEILFRLGIIYKQQGKYEDSLACFDRILRNPPSPLAHADIWFQIGHVYEQQKDYVRAKDAYERVVADNPVHAKVLQQLGWLYHQDGSSFQNQELAIQYLTKSLEADPTDAQSWYLLGRAYMAGQKYSKAYEAYQQAVYRDGRNPTFWCSIGVLYFQINQFRDALDAYSRAIRINPYISEVWFDLGSLYESCNNQISDAIDAYARASELDPSNTVISSRLQLLKTAQATGGQLPAAPGPQDVHPTAYASAVVPPPGLTGPPLLLQSGSNRPIFRTDSRGAVNDRNISLPPPSQVGAGRSSPGPFRGGPPPPVILDETRHHPSHTPLAPMEIDRPPFHARDYPIRDSLNRGPAGHHDILLHHPVPQQHPSDDIRNAHGQAYHQDSYFTRPPLRASSASASPPPRVRSPIPPYTSSRQPIGPGQSNTLPPHHSPRTYGQEPPRPSDHEAGWDRHPLPGDHFREWERGRRPRHSGEYVGHPPQPLQQPFYPPPRSPGLHRPSSRERSPRSSHPSRAYWETTPGRHTPPPPPGPQHDPPPPRRYDPRYDARDHRDVHPPGIDDSSREMVIDQRGDGAQYAGSPQVSRLMTHHPPPPPPHIVGSSARPSESPLPTPAPEQKERRRRGAKDKDTDASMSANQGPPPKKERKKRTNKRAKEEQMPMEASKSFTGERAPPGPSFKMSYGHSPEPISANGSGSSRSVQPSPTSATPRAPSRVVDEDYDEGVEDALMGLAREASYRAPEASAPNTDTNNAPTRSPTVSSGSRPPPSHHGSGSSTRSRASPTSSLKRPISPGSDQLESKRPRTDAAKRRASSPPGDRRSPMPSTRPSPTPFRSQRASRSPDSRPTIDPYPPSSPLPAVLPPHPRPIGSGLASHSNSSSGLIALPPIATLSPTPSAPSPSTHERDEMIPAASRSSSPPSRSKLTEIVRPGGSPPVKHTPSPSSSMRVD